MTGIKTTPNTTTIIGRYIPLAFCFFKIAPYFLKIAQAGKLKRPYTERVEPFTMLLCHIVGIVFIKTGNFERFNPSLGY